jgi:hypothetical protein
MIGDTVYIYSTPSLAINTALTTVTGLEGFIYLWQDYPALTADWLEMLHDREVRFLRATADPALSPVGLIYLFWDFSPQTVLLITIVMTCVSLPVSVLYTAAQLPMYMKLLPKDRYGQFGSADAMVRSISTIVFGFLAGVFMDLMKDWYGDPWCYRLITVWSVFFQAIAMIFFYFLYRGWQRHGGLTHYVPPETGVV